jgi:translocation and assembly module TamB
MRRTLRITAWSLGSLLLLLLAAAIAVLVAGNTRAGRHLIEHAVTSASDGSLRLSGLEGSFPTEIRLEHLQLSDARGVWLTADHVALNWSPAALLARHVDVDSLEIATVDIARRPVTAPSSAQRGWRLPRLDLHRLAIGTLILQPSLAGSRADLTLQGTLHVASLSDATGSLLARRTDGPGGDYELALRSDKARLDASLHLKEAAGGALENLLHYPQLGGISVEAHLSGPRSAEEAVFQVRAGDLRGEAHGRVNLTDQSADLAFALDAPSMAPGPGLSWRSLALQGRWLGDLKAPRADARVALGGLELSGDTRVEALHGDLHANGGALGIRLRAEGLIVPGPEPHLLSASPLQIDATAQLDQPERPVHLTAVHRLLTLQADAKIAENPDVRFSARLPELAPLAQLAGIRLRGRSALAGSMQQRSGATILAINADNDLADDAALPVTLLGGHSRLELAATVTDRAYQIKRLSLRANRMSLAATVDARRGATAAAPALESLRMSSMPCRGSLAAPPG